LQTETSSALPDSAESAIAQVTLASSSESKHHNISFSVIISILSVNAIKNFTEI
jgi:hypothetical protein